MIQESYDRALKILREHKGKLIRLAEKLEEKEVLGEEDIKEVLGEKITEKIPGEKKIRRNRTKLVLKKANAHKSSSSNPEK
ncbi:unnamed protein product [marine sediment metagenome]|uniref:Peptidase M41 domain-containing protein n=1 Tax=marine sediment metagenome TaxID=412755 RepID=X1RJD0_9ZZZZ